MFAICPVTLGQDIYFKRNISVQELQHKIENLKTEPQERFSPATTRYIPPVFLN